MIVGKEWKEGRIAINVDLIECHVTFRSAEVV